MFRRARHKKGWTWLRHTLRHRLWIWMKICVDAFLYIFVVYLYVTDCDSVKASYVYMMIIINALHAYMYKWNAKLADAFETKWLWVVLAHVCKGSSSDTICVLLHIHRKHIYFKCVCVYMNINVEYTMRFYLVYIRVYYTHTNVWKKIDRIHIFMSEFVKHVRRRIHIHTLTF